jgi:1-acyl-sn-glycerol-3-phosphate acyltransferase
MRRNMKLVDCKNRFMYMILNWISQLFVAKHFQQVRIEGAEKIPRGAFIAIANHSARWDGPIVNQVLKRQSNWMVAPNELRGLQGALLRTFGAFPANPKFDLLHFMRRVAVKGEPIVIFPEGDIYRDDATHLFKPGAARIALNCASDGLDVPILPIAIKYSRTKPEAVTVLVGDPIKLDDRIDAYRRDPSATMQSLSLQLHREVCHLRAALGSRRDRELVFQGKPNRSWAPQTVMQTRRI